MGTLYDKGDRFQMRTGSLVRQFEIVKVITIPGISGKRAKLAKREYHVKNNSLYEHPAMTEATKEKLRYFTIKQETLDAYIKNKKWSKL